ncbi:hypothetical protein E2C01_006475 [Portunus trituberculatus]|uniref:Uncharacterized protein n=1 Tax=Portunus trituberculatus TaxID=210409 RepID=A0A5B7CXZ5_PORTR|nr:hypothetical protein [Portunus trituberculatus]
MILVYFNKNSPPSVEKNNISQAPASNIPNTPCTAPSLPLCPNPAGVHPATCPTAFITRRHPGYDRPPLESAPRHRAPRRSWTVKSS